MGNTILYVHISSYVTDASFSLTPLTSIVDEDHFDQEVPRGSVDDGMDGPEERGPGLVVEDNDDGGCGEGGVPGSITQPTTLLPPNIREGSVERNPITRHHIETVHLEQFVHLWGFKRWDKHGLPIPTRQWVRVEQIRVYDFYRYEIRNKRVNF
jgi:hypothetical protein